ARRAPLPGDPLQRPPEEAGQGQGAREEVPRDGRPGSKPPGMDRRPARGQVMRAAARATFVLTLLAALAADPPAAAPPPAVISGADAKARIAAAQEMKKKDAAGLAKALGALGVSKT